MKNINRRIKSIAAAALVLALVAFMHTPAQPVYAEGGAKVNLASAEGLDKNAEFTFHLYKIGSLTHGEGGQVILQIDSDLADRAMVNGTTSYDGSDDQAAALLDSSNTVGNYIKANSDQFTEIASDKVTPGNSITFSGLEDDILYILVGDTVEAGGKTWTPKSVYMGITGGDNDMAITMVKLVSAPVPDEYSVIKMWETDETDQDAEDPDRPDSIRVNIKYGNFTVDTVTLSDDNDWSYSWKSADGDDDFIVYSNDTHNSKAVISDRLNDSNEWSYSFKISGSDNSWHVEEVADSSISMYTAKVTDPSESAPGRFTITNKHQPPGDNPPPPGTPPVRTGDYSNLTRWIAAAVAAGVLLIIFFVKGRRRDRREADSTDNESH